MKYICKLYFWEEYETPIGRLQTIRCNESTAGQWQYKYEKIKSYFRNQTFKTFEEANDWGQNEMYIDPDLDYDVEEIKGV